MFEIDYICKGVYDLYWRGDEEYDWLFVTTCSSYEEAQEEIAAFNLTGSYSGDYNL